MRRLAVPAAISLVALAAVVWWAAHQHAPRLPSGQDALGELALALALYVAASAGRAERWHRILDRGDARASRADAYRLTAVGYMGNNILPAKAGEGLRVLLLAARSRLSRREVLGSVIAERLLDAVALGTVFAFVASRLLGRLGSPGGVPVGLLVAAGAIALTLAALGWGLAVRHGSDRRVRRALAPVFGATRALVSRFGLGLLVLSVGIWALEAAVYLEVGRALHLGLGVGGALAVMVAANLFALLPAAPGYIGTFDAGVLAALATAGTAHADGLAYLLALRFVLFVPITLAGAVILITRYGGWSRAQLRRVRADSADPPVSVSGA